MPQASWVNEEDQLRIISGAPSEKLEYVPLTYTVVTCAEREAHVCGQ